MLRLLHEGHVGIEKCKQRAREAMYWPSRNADIDILVGRYSTCLTYRDAQHKETILPHDQIEQPWAKVACDIFYLSRQPYLLTHDYYSHFPEVALLASESIQTIIRHLKSQFARFGIPVYLMSDNSPQFDSAEFAAFAKEWGFSHITSSPRYPQSNGLADNGVKIMKRLMMKATESGDDAFLAMLSYRNSPMECGKSPAEMLLMVDS